MCFSFFHVFAHVVCFGPRWLLVRAINNNEIREQTNYWVELIGRCCSIKCSLSEKMLAVELYRFETVCRHGEKCVSFKFDKQFLRVGEKEQQFRCFGFKRGEKNTYSRLAIQHQFVWTWWSRIFYGHFAPTKQPINALDSMPFDLWRRLFLHFHFAKNLSCDQSKVELRQSNTMYSDLQINEKKGYETISHFV